MKEPGINVTAPASGYIPGHGSGQTTSFSLSNLSEHMELKLTVGLRGKQVYPFFGPEDEGPPPPVGVWKFEVWFGSGTTTHYRWWYTDSSGAGGDPLAIVHHDSSFNVTVKGTWLSSGPAPGWYLESAKVERFTPTVFIYPVDTAVEGTTNYPGAAPGFMIWRSGDNLLGDLEVDLSAPGERDAMAPPPGTNTVGAIVTGLRTGPWPAPGLTIPYHWLALDVDLDAHEFEGGSITIPALGKTVPVMTNTDEFGAVEELMVRPADLTPADVAALAAGGLAVTVTDDDDITVLGVPGAPRLVNGGSLITSAFADMYVLPIYADMFNGTVMVPFDRHVGGGDFIGDPNYDNSRNLPNLSNFWSSLVVSAFEPQDDADADADSDLTLPGQLPIPYELPIYGYTADAMLLFTQNLSLIFLETLRDRANEQTTEAHTLVHELGHAGRDDSDDQHQATGLMRVGAPNSESQFDLGTQAIIRGKEKW